MFWEVIHCVKTVQIRSFFRPVFSCIRTEYIKIQTKKTPRIWKLFTQWFMLGIQLMFSAVIFALLISESPKLRAQSVLVPYASLCLTCLVSNVSSCPICIWFLHVPCLTCTVSYLSTWFTCPLSSCLKCLSYRKH